MTSKTISLGIAAVAVATGITFSNLPAQAAALTGGITIRGDQANIPDLTTIGSTGNLTFGSPSSLSSQSGSFTGISLGTITINPLPLTLTAQSIVLGTTTSTYDGAGVNPFINFGTQTIDGVTDALTFALNPGSYIGTFQNGVFNFQTATGVLDGFFLFNGTTLGGGILNAFESSQASGYTIRVEAVPIPSPVLLPGLVALGVSALRKRKGEMTETVEN
jgi:ABC-type glucose/galactose transport system permease subunit